MKKRLARILAVTLGAATLAHRLWGQQWAENI